ncbi:SDR family NAD(P)-dependent oxidoreductase [Phenylobacterium sp.]|uniref:SDR family NAD(P)-dependent oxidoreductase n=1 Tax=Phenylobacterium sp. TaxID=1871053 RepID=UPI002FC5FF97
MPDPNYRHGALRGRRAIITGAARGIGLACARRFAAEGAGVLIVDLDAAAGEAVVAEMGWENLRAVFHPADLSRPEAIPGIVEAAVRGLGGVDILVNNAGIAPTADFFELDHAQFDQVMAINLRAPFLLTQAVARRMREQGTPGAVVNLSSINAVLNGPTSLSYCVSKGGLNQLTRSCAIALAPHGIRVNAVGPGTIATELAAQAGLTGEGVAPVLERTPMGRLGEAAEIAAVAAFLASDDASFVSGQTVYADGGRLGLNYSLPRAGQGEGR